MFIQPLISLCFNEWYSSLILPVSVATGERGEAQWDAAASSTRHAALAPR